MNLISLEQVEKTLNSEPLFSEVSFGINQGEKIGFIGPNGSGKSTLMRLLNGEIQPDKGKISKNRELKTSFLHQQPIIDPEKNVGEQLYLASDPRVELIKAYHQATEAVEAGASSMEELDQLTLRMEQEQGWNLEQEYLSYLTELGIHDLKQSAGELSGGMTRKVAMARMMSSGANLLFLDEPTNHLDTQTIEWLENWLRKTPISFVMVTHDRYFLDRVCNHILELDRQRIFKYPGNYAASLKRKDERLEQERRAEQRRQTILKRELAWLQQGPKARTGRDKHRLGKVMDLMNQETQDLQRLSEFTAGNRRLGKKILELHKISKSYGEKQVVAPFSYTFKRGERIGIIGPNGAGKTSFLDVITQRQPLNSGRMELGVNTHFGYFDQMSRPMNPNSTPIGFIREKADKVLLPDGTQKSASAYLEQFLFPKETHRIPIERLSGGERRRLYLIRILMDSPNFLILDEPTNDLDLDTLSLLEEYIDNYQGCLLIVSHDRAFLDRTTDYLFIFDDKGVIRGFSGNYSDYQEALNEERKEKERLLRQKKKESKKKQEKSRPKGLSYKEKLEMDQLMEEIMTLEEEKSQLEDFFSNSTTDPSELESKNHKYKAVCETITKKTQRWEELADLET